VTKSETTKLEKVSDMAIRMEERQQNMEEKLDSIEKKLDKFIEASEKKFITRLEGLAVVAFLSAAATLIVIYANIKDKL
jgi:hypothetical protein